MPFGSIFAALFFGGVCGAIGLRWLLVGPASVRVAGLLLTVLGGSLACGLLRRRDWARWTGAAVGLLLVGFGARLVATRGEVLEHVLLLAALLTAALLIVPATGDARRGALREPSRGKPGVGAAGWMALASCAGLLTVGLWSDLPATGPLPGADATLPAAAIGKSVRWSAFGPGLERARAENRPVLATFVTDWCPYCSKMARDTWRASSVAERLDQLVPVKVDAEDDGNREGPSGRELAERYGIAGFPAQILLDPAGRVIARHDGYQGPRELLSWVDDALGGAPSVGAAAFPGAAR